MMIDRMKLPGDVKKLSVSQCERLCGELRKLIIEAVRKNGGHLASNLGTVELTVALHRCFSSPRDKIIWDVGHQSYAHKLLTGRRSLVDTLRRKGGITGFTRPSESEHDAFISGHSSNSISAACGIARGMKLRGDDHKVIAIIGDGAFTGGLAYEGLNNAAGLDNLIIVLNDNEMSISKNVGAIAKYLSSIRGRKRYIQVKNAVARTLDKTPVIGEPVRELMVTSKDMVRFFLYRYGGFSGSTMFENMGFVYLGPVDGHNIKELSSFFESAKAIKKPVLIHIKTIKGKGYAPAEENPGAFHALSPGELDTSEPGRICCDTFSAAMGRELTALAKEDDRICAITAAMKYGTGLNTFASEFPERFFDAGIAEGHAVTFAAGLASMGYIPVFAVYSSFLQRSYDEIIHDAAIENTHIVLCIDRAGFTGEDGETHQGIFDVAMLSCIPNTTIYSPSDHDELKEALRCALYETEGIAAVRYPKGKVPVSHNEKTVAEKSHTFTSNNNKTLAVGYGKVGAMLENRIKNADILRLKRIHPLPEDALTVCMRYKKIHFYEEGAKKGGIGEHLACALLAKGYKGSITIHAYDGFMPCATTDEQLMAAGLDAERVE